LRRKKAEYGKKKKEEEKEKKRSHDDDGNEKKKKKKKRKEEKREKKRSHNKKMSTTQEDEKKEYKKLIENWVPLPLQMVPTDFENEEWLATKNDSNDPTKHVSSSSSSTADIKQGIQPLAYFLPHADIYALPYVLPF
ncbi:hypothetical protein L195_g019139, partial [Trifolium pratense]